MVETVGAGAGEPAGRPGLADRTGGRRVSLALKRSIVVVLEHTGLLERGMALAGSRTGAPPDARTNGEAGQSAPRSRTVRLSPGASCCSLTARRKRRYLPGAGRQARSR